MIFLPDTIMIEHVGSTALPQMSGKNIIDIQKTDDSVMLIKKTDDLKSLEHRERKAIVALFPGKDTVVRADKPNLLKFKRALRRLPCWPSVSDRFLP